MRRINGLSSLIQLLLMPVAIPLFYVSVFGLLAFVAITLPYRIFVYIVAKTFWSNLIGFVEGLSSVMATEPIHANSYSAILQVFVFDDVISINRFREMFQERIIDKRDPLSGELVYGKFQQYWENIMGYNMWRWESEFNIDKHIKSSMGSYTRKDLPQLMSHFQHQLFKRGQSPWEITLIHNYTEDSEDGPGIGRGKMLVVNRVHHALADGLSLYNVFQRDLANKPKPRDMPQANPVEHPWWKKVALLHLFQFNFINFLIQSYDPKNTWVYPLNSRSNPAQGKYFTSITTGILVSQVSAVKNKYNVSYLAVLLHCLIQGVRQTLEKEGRSVPDKVLFILPRAKPHHPGGLTNHAFGSAIPLSMEKTSTVSSLRNIEKELMTEKLSVLPIGLDIFAKFSSLLPSTLLYFVITKWLPPGFGFTNLPVPKDVTSYDGVNMTDYLGIVGPMSPQRTLVVAAVGDGGKQNLVASVDQSSYSSQAAFEKLGDYIKEEFNSLVESLQDNE